MQKSVTIEQESTISDMGGQLVIVIQKKNHHLVKDSGLVNKKKLNVTLTFTPLEES